MNLRASLTVMLPISAFMDPESPDSGKITLITPDKVTRFAFDRKSGYQKVEIGNQTGPQNDGMLELVDAIRLEPNQMDFPGYDRALIARIQSTREMDSYSAERTSPRSSRPT
ncbi:MAG: hypothetical protein NUV84_03240 [Candidatus Uhrbacteria bacterium]|nr:hypothetical protein [Candidatus Uhrbacteria bacterium]